jgi:NAD(P)-dependent dehydrogenase (short-subunit alcohol dehydrogenase family)
MDIVDKRVVVTGAASGIGKALAIEFKNEKAKDIVLADLNDDVLKVAENWDFRVLF